jgi:hypothetical protein
MKYLIETEYGEIFLANEITDSEISASIDGALTIIDIQNRTVHTIDDDWSEIDMWEH